MKKYKNNVIQFPDKLSDNYFRKLNLQEDSVEMARFCMHVIQEALEQQDWSELSQLDLTDPDSNEYKDMFVVLNLLVATLMRTVDLDHMLQEDLDLVYMKLKLVEYSEKNNVDISHLLDDGEDE
jgi:hypothetical protein